MKTSDLGLAIAFLAATGLVITHAVANETYAAPDIVAGRENNAPDETAPPLQQHRARSAPTQIAEGGSDKLLERRVAEGGAERLRERERRVADIGNSYGSAINVNAHFSMD